MIGYTILDKSMNGIKTLSDGITTISNGNIVTNEMTTNNISSSNSSVLKNLTITGDCTTQKLDVNVNTNFLNLPKYIGSLDPSESTQLITKSYADTNYTSSSVNILNNVKLLN